MNNCGIYQFRNIINNTIYIGSALKLNKRRNRHLRELRKNNHHSIKFQRSFNKYGENNFEFSILEYVTDINNLVEREQYYLDIILFANTEDNQFDNLSLNIARVAYSSLGTKRSKESKLKMSIKAKERFRRESPWNKNKKDIYSQETLEIMRLSKKGKKLSPEHAKKVILNLRQPIGPLSDETKIKISKSKLGQGVKSVLQFDLDNNFIKEFESILKASMGCNINRSSISANCRGIQKRAGNYIWKYK